MNEAKLLKLARDAAAAAAFWIEENSRLSLGEDEREALAKAILRILRGERS